MIEQMMKDDNFFDLKYGNRKIYFDTGEWMVVEAKSGSTPYKLLKAFPEDCLAEAIELLKSQ